MLKLEVGRKELILLTMKLRVMTTAVMMLKRKVMKAGLVKWKLNNCIVESTGFFKLNVLFILGGSLLIEGLNVSGNSLLFWDWYPLWRSGYAVNY